MHYVNFCVETCCGHLLGSSYTAPSNIMKSLGTAASVVDEARSEKMQGYKRMDIAKLPTCGCASPSGLYHSHTQACIDSAYRTSVPATFAGLGLGRGACSWLRRRSKDGACDYGE